MKTAHIKNFESFRDLRFGICINLGLYSLGARHEWLKRREQLTNEAYNKYFERFNPKLFKPDELAKIVKDSGAGYVVVNAKSLDGFCLWDSKYTDYKVSNTPYGKDILREMLDAFRAAGLQTGLSYSLIDWHHEDFAIDSFHPLFNTDTPKIKCRKARYAKYIREQINELLSNYGKMNSIRFNFSYPGENGKGKDDWESEKLFALVKKIQPDILINDQLDLPVCGDFSTSSPAKEANPQMLREESLSFSDSNAYARDTLLWKNTETIIKLIVKNTAGNANSLLQIGPAAKGELDPATLRLLDNLGNWFRHNEEAICGCGAAPAEFPEPDCGRYTYNQKTSKVYLHLLNWPLNLLHLQSMEGKLEYAQMLHDESEIKFRDRFQKIDLATNDPTKEGFITLELPVRKPETDIPVIELSLKKHNY